MSAPKKAAMMGTYFSLEELVRSETAMRMDLHNDPDQEEFLRLYALVYLVLDPIREHVQTPVIVSSGFRSQDVNTLIGGENDSQHRKGEAADIHAVGISAKQLFEKIMELELSHLDQCILEFGRWVHVSVSEAAPRKEYLIAEKRFITDKKSQVVYIPAVHMRWRARLASSPR